MKEREERIWKFAKAIKAMADADLINDPEMKPAIKDMIRKAGENHPYFHSFNHFRSRAVRAQTEHLKNPREYHQFCRGRFRHEHIVPTEVIYRLLVNAHSNGAKHSTQWIFQWLNKLCYCATITHEEDKLLNESGFKQKMPDGFLNPIDKKWMDIMARYRESGILENVVKDPAFFWGLDD